MQKVYYHNYKTINENKDNKKLLPIAAVKNSIVDINILLNRVKIKENDEKKQKLFFLGSAVLILSVMTLFSYLLK